MRWFSSAKCRLEGQDPNFFYPTGVGGRRANGDEARNREHQEKLATAYCNSCHAREDCLEYALAERLDDGVMGGMTAAERISLRRRRQKFLRRAIA
jgi:WhiB family transcriptional regulator, redox-sensing transcriptional regulator